MTTRRGFLASILAAGVAPAAVGSGILMPVRPPILLPWQETIKSILFPSDDQPWVIISTPQSEFVPSREIQRAQRALLRVLAIGLDLGRPGGDMTAIAWRTYGQTVKFVRRRP